MAAGRLEAELLCNLPLLLLAAKATASEKELRALPVGRRILLAALLPQRCFTSMKKAWLLRALSPQGDVDFFSLLKSGSVVRAAEIAYLVEYFDRHVGRSRRGRRGAAPFADLDHNALVELIGSNTDEASLRRLKLHVVRL